MAYFRHTLNCYRRLLSKEFNSLNRASRHLNRRVVAGLTGATYHFSRHVRISIDSPASGQCPTAREIGVRGGFSVPQAQAKMIRPGFAVGGFADMADRRCESRQRATGVVVKGRNLPCGPCGCSMLSIGSYCVHERAFTCSRLFASRPCL